MGMYFSSLEIEKNLLRIHTSSDTQVQIFRGKKLMYLATQNSKGSVGRKIT